MHVLWEMEVKLIFLELSAVFSKFQLLLLLSLFLVLELKLLDEVN